MTLKEAIKELEYYQKWRIGADIPQPKPKDITESIDIAIHIMKQLTNTK